MNAERGQDVDGAPWEPDQLLADRYRVGVCIRQSGTCHLYRVEDVFRGQFHLVLRPSVRLLAREGWREWFERYCGNALSVPAHPSILACERVTGDRGVPFLVMEDAEGRGWDSLIFHGGLVELPAMLDVARQSAEGLAWLHSHGHIHYNAKPGNVLVCGSGAVKVWKYGESDVKTRAYASPEQLAGGRPLTPATDVWSWAVSVLHMFVGRTVWPSGADAPLVLRRYMQNGPAREGIPLMPGPLARLLAQCLKSDPDERVVTMDEIAEALKGIHTDAVSARRERRAGARDLASPPMGAQALAASQGSGEGSAAPLPPRPGAPDDVTERLRRDRDDQRPAGPRRYPGPG